MPTWKSATLVFLQYNNYYNRIVKREEDPLNYLNYELFRLTATNFNPADGVNTEHIVNMDDGIYPDYMVVYNEASELVSRWFIIECDRIRGGQYRITLHRDTVADYYEDITSAPCFIEKATLDYDDPLIFNEEDMTFNQIKTNETLLKDKSGSAWLVGYCDKKHLNDIKGTVDYNNPTDLPHKVLDVLSITQWEFYKYTEPNTPLLTPAKTINYEIDARANISNGTAVKYIIDQDVNVTSRAGTFNSSLYTKGTVLNIKDRLRNSVNKIGINTLILDTAPEFQSNISEIAYKEFLSYNVGDILKTGDNKYYEITSIILNKQEKSTKSITAGRLYEDLLTIVNDSDAFTGTPNAHTFKAEITYDSFSITIEEKTELNINYDISGTKILTTDAPYQIIAIPFKDFFHIEHERVPGTFSSVYSRQDVAIATAMSMLKDHPGYIYDFQLVPYCPVPNLIRIDDILRIQDELQISPITKGTGPDAEILSYIFHVPSAKFSTNIECSINGGKTAVEKKVINQCDKYRICSPNFNGYFDFSVAKNGGVNYFNVDCTYKPYQPYIHINPDFNNLYGKDWDDPRGLICGGDFSLTQILDKWQEYQIQNKNFQEIFNRQIENLEVQNKYQRQQDIAAAIAGTFQGGVSGAATGLLASGGNPYAAAAGVIGGTAISGITGALDVRINQALRNEAIDLTKDNFGYQLGNIQALPSTLTKVSSLNNNNKIFPVLEYYTCTDREKEALRNKLKYNGMTVMAIGTIGDYIQSEPSYIKGQIIRLPEINEDFHIANEIAREINLGVYI